MLTKRLNEINRFKRKTITKETNKQVHTCCKQSNWKRHTIGDSHH